MEMALKIIATAGIIFTLLSMACGFLERQDILHGQWAAICGAMAILSGTVFMIIIVWSF